MKICVNDQPRVVSEAVTLAVLLEEIGLAGRGGLAVAVNDAVVPRSAWPVRNLAEGDRVLVIQATQGG